MTSEHTPPNCDGCGQPMTYADTIPEGTGTLDDDGRPVVTRIRRYICGDCFRIQRKRIPPEPRCRACGSPTRPVRAHGSGPAINAHACDRCGTVSLSASSTAA